MVVSCWGLERFFPYKLYKNICLGLSKIKYGNTKLGVCGMSHNECLVDVPSMNGNNYE